MRIRLLSAAVVIAAAIALSSFMFNRVGRGNSGPDSVPPKPAVDLPQPKEDEKTRTAVFAGGCFWCTDGTFRQLKGVTETVSGYAGGTKATADYETVSTGTTGHAESVRVTYDPRVITYGQLMQIFFFSFDPTTKDQQGPDRGHQYRTAIFYENDDQKKIAEAYIKHLADAKFYDKPIVTTIEPIGEGFFPAEKYHQDYVGQHPDQGYIREWALPHIDKLRTYFKNMVKPAKDDGDSKK